MQTAAMNLTRSDHVRLPDSMPMAHLAKRCVLMLSLTLPCATALAAQVSDLFAKVSPSVVVLHTFEQGSPKFRDGEITTASIEGVGSGVLISEDGLILTAAHVVHVADSVHVEFQDGTRTLGRVLASDRDADIALVKIERAPEGVMSVPLADSDAVAIGDEIIVIGAPYGLGHTLSVGHISGRRVADDDDLFAGTELFQTDAAINQGNSGGPLFTLDGEVAGVVSHILSRSGGYEGMGFAVSSNTVRKLLLEQRGFWSGIDGVLLEGPIAMAFNLPATAGYLVERVAQGSAAHKAGIRGGELPISIANREVVIGGDVILQVGDVRVGSEGARGRLREQLQRLAEGDVLPVRVLRAGEVLTLEITIPSAYR